MSNSQEHTSGTVANLLDEGNPVGVPLSARYRKGFAFKTIGYRLPVILTKVIDQMSRDKNEIGERLGQEARSEVKEVVGALAKLKNELVTNKAITEVNDPVWDDYLSLMAKTYFDDIKEEVKWFFTPWLHAECYFYRRIRDAFTATKYLKEYDPFRKQKKEAYREAVEASSVLGVFTEGKLTGEVTDDILQTFLELSLWGNKCDLSLSTGEKVSQNCELGEQLGELRKSILCDDSTQVWSTLSQAIKDNGGQESSIGYVFDNAGFELFTDLLLADALMSRVQHINFYVKALPWFISDVMVYDFHWLLKAMRNESGVPVLQKLGEKWSAYVESGKWSVVDEPFWTYSHGFHEMKDADTKLYDALSKESFLIFKGDLNYRKLTGDVNWPHDTPFKDSLRGFLPAPLVTLRTLKADVVAGISLKISKELQSKDPDWMVTGNYGLIQLAK